MIPRSPTSGLSSKESPHATPSRTVNSSPSTKSWTEAPVLTKEKGNRLFKLRKSQVKVRSNSPDPDADSSYISAEGYSAAGIRVPGPTKITKTNKNQQQQQQQQHISAIGAEESSETTSHGGYSAAGIRLPSSRRSSRLLRYKAAHLRSNADKTNKEGINNCDATNNGISSDHYSPDPPSLSQIKSISNTTRNLDAFFTETKQPTVNAANPGDNGTHASGDRAAGGSTTLLSANRGDDGNYYYHPQKQPQYSLFSQPIHPHPTFAAAIRPSTATTSVKSSTAYSCTTKTISEDLRSNTSEEPSTSSTIRSAQAIESMLLFQKPDFLNSQADVSSHRWNIMPSIHGSLRFGPPLKPRPSIQGSSSSSVLSDLPYMPPRKEGLIPNTRRHIQQTLLSSRSDRSFSESEGFSSPPYDSKGSSKVNFLLPEKSDIRSRSRTLLRDNAEWPSASSFTVTSSVISDLPEVPTRQAGLVPEAVGTDWISLNHTQKQQQQQQIEANGQSAASHQDDSLKKASVPLQQQSYMQEHEERDIFYGASRKSSGATNTSSLQRSEASSSVASSFVSALPIVPPRPIGLIPNKSADLNQIYGYHAAKDDIGEAQGANDESNVGLNDTDEQINSNIGNEPQVCRFNPHMSVSASASVSPLVVTATDATLPSSSGNVTNTTTITAICISGTNSESFNGQSALSNEKPLIIDHEKRRTFLQNIPTLKKMQHQVSGLTMSGTESGSSSKIEAEKEPTQTQAIVSEVNQETKVAVNLTDELEACRQYLSSEKAAKEVIPGPLDTSDQKREKIRLGRNLVLTRDSTLAISDLTISSSLLLESNASLQNTSWYGPSLVRVEEIMDYDSDDDAVDKETRETLKSTDASQNSENKDVHSRLNSQYIAGAIDARTTRRYDEEGDLAAGTVARNFVEGHVVDGGEKQVDERPEPQLFANVMHSASQCVDQVTEWPIISEKKTKVVEAERFCSVLVDLGASAAVQWGGSIEDNGNNNDEGHPSTNSSSNQQQEKTQLDSDSVPVNVSNDIIEEAKEEQGFSSAACDIEEKSNFEVEGIEEKKERSESNLVQKPVLVPLEDEFTSELEVDFPTKIRDVEAIGDLDVSFPPLEKNRRFRQCILGNETDRIVKVDNVIGSKISGKETCEESLADLEDRSVSSSLSKRSKSSQYYRLAEEDGQEAKSTCSNPNGLVDNDRPEVQSVSSFSIFKGTRLNSSSHSVSSEVSRRSRYSHLETKDDHTFKSSIREEQQNSDFDVLAEEESSVIVERSFPDSLRKKKDSSSQSSKGSTRSQYSRLSRGEEREEKSLIDREQIEETISVGSVNKEDKSVNSRASVSSSRRNRLNSSCHSVSSKGSRRSHQSRQESEDDHKSFTSSEERNIFRKSIERRRREDIFNSGFVDEGIIVASDEDKEKLEVVKERSGRNAFMRDFSNIYDVESIEGVEPLDEISVLESLHEGLDSEDELSKTTEGKEPSALYETWKRCTKPCGQMSWWKWTAVIAVCFLIVGGIVAAIVVPRASSTAPSASSAPTTSGIPPFSTNSTGINASIFDDTPWDESYVGVNNLGLPGDGTGVSVSLSGHGNRLAVGSPYLNTTYGTRAGMYFLSQNGFSFLSC